MVKNPPAKAGDRRDSGSIVRSGRFPRGGHGNSLQYCSLGNPRDKGTWQAIIPKGRKESDMTEAI